MMFFRFKLLLPVTVTVAILSLSKTSLLVKAQEELHPDIVTVLDVVGANPGYHAWHDSYSVGDRCYCKTTFDHEIGDYHVNTPYGWMKIREVCEILGPGPGIAGRPRYNDIQCGNGPPNADCKKDEHYCPGRTDIGRKGCGHIGPTWNFSPLVEETEGPSSSPTVETEGPSSSPTVETDGPSSSPSLESEGPSSSPTVESEAPSSSPTVESEAPSNSPTVTPMDIFSSNHAYLGCWETFQYPDSALDFFAGDGFSLTGCILHCKQQGYAFAGLGSKELCYCGDSYNTYNAHPEERCDEPCTDGGGLCGGLEAISVYAASTGPTDIYKGCFNDVREDRALSVRAPGEYGLNDCIFYCRNKGFPYAGTQFYTECWCGFKYDTHGNATMSECNTPCTHAGGGACGGFLRLSAYDTGLV